MTVTDRERETEERKQEEPGAYVPARPAGGIGRRPLPGRRSSADRQAGPRSPERRGSDKGPSPAENSRKGGGVRRKRFFRKSGRRAGRAAPWLAAVLLLGILTAAVCSAAASAAAGRYLFSGDPAAVKQLLGAAVRAALDRLAERIREICGIPHDRLVRDVSLPSERTAAALYAAGLPARETLAAALEREGEDALLRAFDALWEVSWTLTEEAGEFCLTVTARELPPETAAETLGYGEGEKARFRDLLSAPYEELWISLLPNAAEP